MAAYKSGTDLLLGIMSGSTFKALGHSSSCTISYSSETGEHITKEATDAKWNEKYVKTLSVSISAEGFVYDDDDATSSARGFETLRSLWLAASPVTLVWKERTGTDGAYTGSFIITSLEDSAPAGDDRKYSISFENSGPIEAYTA